MEVKIGVREVNRELILESTQSAQDIAAAVSAALAGDVLRLTDDRGRQLIVPSAALAYVEIGAEESRRVGFGGTGV